MSTMVKLVLAAMAIVSTGCLAHGPGYTPLAVPSDKCVVYAYRPPKFGGSGMNLQAACDFQVITLGVKGYHVFVLDPKEVMCTARGEKRSQITFQCAPGRSYYVRAEMHPGMLFARPSVELVPETEALGEIRKCKKQN